MEYQETVLAVQKIFDLFPYDKLTLRQIHYQLVSKLYYENTVNNYKRLSRYLVKARLSNKISFDKIIDKTRTSTGFDFGHSGLAVHTFNYKKREYEEAENTFRSSYSDWRSPRWFKQPKYVEVWLEKEALSTLFNRVTSLKRVTLCPSKGYSSLTFLKEGAERLEQFEDHKELVILFFGDFDPTGLDIQRNIKERMEEFGLDITFKKIALTKDQILEMNLPPMPTKKTDVRSKKFIQKHGDLAVELDAIPPDRLRLIIAEAIDNEFDKQIYSKVKVRDKRVQTWMQNEIETSLEQEKQQNEIS